MNFLTDENILPEIVAFLRNLKYDVLDIKESGLSGKSDEFIYDLANNQKRIILTHDSDFGRLLFLNAYKSSGIIYLRPGHFNAQFTIKSLTVLFEKKIQAKTPFIITVENNLKTIKIRIRELEF